MRTGSSLAPAEVQLVATTTDLEALWRADPRATAFQSPHWLIPWWKHIGHGELRTLAVRDGRSDGVRFPARGAAVEVSVGGVDRAMVTIRRVR